MVHMGSCYSSLFSMIMVLMRQKYQLRDLLFSEALIAQYNRLLSANLQMTYLINIEQATTPFGGNDSPSSTPRLIPYTLSDTNALQKTVTHALRLNIRSYCLSPP